MLNPQQYQLDAQHRAEISRNALAKPNPKLHEHSFTAKRRGVLAWLGSITRLRVRVYFVAPAPTQAEIA